MIITTLQTEDLEDYSAFLTEMQGTLLYHSVKYKSLLENILNCQAVYLVAKDGKKICGVLPLMKKQGKYGIVYNSLPYYGSHGGIIAKDQSAFKALLEKYEEIISAGEVAAATLIENPFHSLVYTIQTDLLDTRISQATPLLSTGKDDLLKSFDSSTRRNINKAIASQITIQKDSSQLPFIYQLHVENMQSIGGRAKHSHFFDSIPKTFIADQDYSVFVAYKDGEPIAGVLLFYFKDTVEYFTPVVKEEFRTYQALALTIYQAMLDAIEKGFTQWNWGGTWLTQEGVYRFKKKWGSVDREYRYYTKLKNAAIYQSNPQELLKEYPDFFVLPFQALQKVAT